MDLNNLYKLSIEELETIKNCFNSKDESSKQVLKNIEEVISYKKDIISRKIDFTSDRMPNYKKKNEALCLKLIREINLEELYFFRRSLSARVVNTMPIYSCICESGKDISLENYERMFESEYCISVREGIYNNYNYIKNYIYYLLSENENLTKEDIFKDYDEKYELASKKLTNICKYLYDTKKKTNGLYLSVGNEGLAASTKRTDCNKPLTFHQSVITSAVAFGTSIEKLENNDFEDSKRLLFIPRRVYDKMK